MVAKPLVKESTDGNHFNQQAVCIKLIRWIPKRLNHKFTIISLISLIKNYYISVIIGVKF
jgi:hypothetical protein